MTVRALALLTALLALTSCRKKSSPADASIPPNRAAIRALVLAPPAPVRHDLTALTDPAQRAEALVQIHCQRCHQLPDPSLLTKKLWVNTVLPEMGCYLGAHHYIPQYSQFIEKGTTPEEAALFHQRVLYAPQPLLPQQDWDLIVTWFLQRSPDTMPSSNNLTPPPLPEGKFEIAFLGPPNAAPETTLLAIDPARHRFLTSDASTNSLSLHDPDGKLLSKIEGPGTFTVAHQHPDATTRQFIAVGVLNPNDLIAGSLWAAPAHDSLDALTQSSLPLLKRPVSAIWHDFDHDGKEEIVVAEFGNKTGQLSLFHQDSSGQWEQTVLNHKSGNRTVRLADMNHDGWDDLVVLRAQESEDLLIYYNTGNLEFLESHVLQFPPVWGSNDFDLADLNQDGHLDLLLANGDNADSTNVLKNFHGIHLYLNNGKGGFSLLQSFPFHGAYGVRALDADLDGDLDFVTFSTFPDFENNQESIRFYEQTKLLTFQPYALPESVRSRWIVMDVGDLDGDGDHDILFGPNIRSLGANSTALAARAQALPGPFLYLRNLAQP